MSKHAIWKYELLGEGDQYVEMPEGAQFLSVQMQRSTACLWAIVNPDAPRTRRHIEILGTGQPIGDGTRSFIDTFQMCGGSLVFHVFEKLS